MKCVCGHWHAATCHCGCSYPEPDDDGIEPADWVNGGWRWSQRDGYRYEATQASEGISL